MGSDLNFITNENERNLLNRFKTLIKDTELFDVLVGYFFTSGFHALYKSLENTKKVRILVGIGTSKKVVDLIYKAKESGESSMPPSHAEVREGVAEEIANEVTNSDDSQIVEEGIGKFVEWIQSGKLEVKAYPTENIHAKLYIMTFDEKDRDKGRVITGSSNFSQAGLVDNLEFNVELKNRSDYDFALSKFNELWEDAVDISDKYVETLHTNTWLNPNIKPYDLYLKFLYEYFKDELSQTDEVLFKFVPAEFKKLEYQEQAVLNAKKILDQFGGVFISDVVGLGKTYISAMLANQLDGRNLVLAPPMLLDKNNPGSWRNVFVDFGVSAVEFESLGKLDQLVKRGTEKYKNVFIDEAHRFRSESNVTYENLAQICRGKRVILVTATPYNNTPKDVLSQIKLFQKGKKSTIPNVSDLESFFSKLERKIDKLDRKKDRKLYMEISKSNAKSIREEILKHLMVRRTRTEIERYFSNDLKNQGLKFPEVIDPEALYYEFDDNEDRIFTMTIDLVVNKFQYARYTPMLYYRGKITHPEELAQKNMRKFMKILLIKRLESSFYAFRKSIDRFIASYEIFLNEFNRNNVYVSKKYTYKVFELIENGDDEALQKLINEDKARKYASKDFDDRYKGIIENDLKVLKKIRDIWKTVKRDPKLIKMFETISKRKIMKENKSIIFTESKETAEYLASELQKKGIAKILVFTGGSGVNIREKVIDNFDAKAKHPKDDFKILISTEVLSEGVNLHRANIVVNYDIPWNPTRLMQRVGRINRVDTDFDKIYTFNFFPTKQSNDLIKLQEAAEAKIHAFISMLGADAQLLTEGESIESHELFNRLISKKTITGEDENQESELKYLNIIKDIRDENPDLFERIKRLPKKSRTSKRYKEKQSALITYFRKGKLNKFFIASDRVPKELDFINAAKILETIPETVKEKLGNKFYEYLEKNKQAFTNATMEEMPEVKGKGGRDSATQVLRILKAINKDMRQFTEDQEIYLRKVMNELEEGGLPKQTMKTVLQELNKAVKEGLDTRKILAIVRKNIPSDLLKEHISESAANTFGPREVILSEYLVGE